jgi:hypothetical protein
MAKKDPILAEAMDLGDKTRLGRAYQAAYGIQSIGRVLQANASGLDCADEDKQFSGFTKGGLYAALDVLCGLISSDLEPVLDRVGEDPWRATSAYEDEVSTDGDD